MISNVKSTCIDFQMGIATQYFVILFTDFFILDKNAFIKNNLKFQDFQALTTEKLAAFLHNYSFCPIYEFYNKLK